MLTKRISPQKARSILTISFGRPLSNEEWHSLYSQDYGSLLLATGAKIERTDYRKPGGEVMYFLSGYAQDGSDVNHYLN